MRVLAWYFLPVDDLSALAKRPGMWRDVALAPTPFLSLLSFPRVRVGGGCRGQRGRKEVRDRQTQEAITDDCLRESH